MTERHSGLPLQAINDRLNLMMVEVDQLDAKLTRRTEEEIDRQCPGYRQDVFVVESDVKQMHRLLSHFETKLRTLSSHTAEKGTEKKPYRFRFKKKVLKPL